MLPFLMAVEDVESRDLLEKIYRAYHKEMFLNVQKENGGSKRDRGRTPPSKYCVSGLPQ